MGDERDESELCCIRCAAVSNLTWRREKGVLEKLYISHRVKGNRIRILVLRQSLLIHECFIVQQVELEIRTCNLIWMSFSAFVEKHVFVV